MKRYIRLIALVAICTLLATCVYSQTQNAFTIDGAVTKPLTLTLEKLSRFKAVEIKAKGHDGKEHTYKGVQLVTLLDSAGVTLGTKLRGANLGQYVLIKAADGYKVTFSLPEIDPEFSNNTVLLAYQEDGKPLAEGEGPFRIVAPADKKHARWIRDVTTIRVLLSKD